MTFSLQLAEIDSDRVEQLMFDDGHHSISAVYYKLFQVLRVFQGMANEMRDDFGSWSFVVRVTFSVFWKHFKTKSDGEAAGYPKSKRQCMLASHPNRSMFFRDAPDHLPLKYSF